MICDERGYWLRTPYQQRTGKWDPFHPNYDISGGPEYREDGAFFPLPGTILGLLACDIIGALLDLLLCPFGRCVRHYDGGWTIFRRRDAP